MGQRKTENRQKTGDRKTDRWGKPKKIKKREGRDQNREMEQGVRERDREKKTKLLYTHLREREITKKLTYLHYPEEDYPV